MKRIKRAWWRVYYTFVWKKQNFTCTAHYRMTGHQHFSEDPGYVFITVLRCDTAGCNWEGGHG